MQSLNQLLWIVGVVLGVFQMLYGFWRFYADKIVPALFVSLAVVIAGPFEDILKNAVRRRHKLPPEEPAVKTVDLATSVGFLICLIIAIYLM